MSNVIKLFAGRTKPGAKLPKPRNCAECGEPIETARLQVLEHGVLAPRLCVSCKGAEEARERRIMASARDDDIVIIRRR